jgi:DnaJ-class molecular chaperone
MNHYEVFGIERDASDKEIKRGYREMVRKWHPDKCDGSQYAKKKYNAVNEAHIVLSDPIKKKQYDAVLNAERNKSMFPFMANMGNFMSGYVDSDSDDSDSPIKNMDDFRRKLSELKETLAKQTPISTTYGPNFGFGSDSDSESESEYESESESESESDSESEFQNNEDMYKVLMADIINKGEDINVVMKVSLNEIYKGGVKKLQVVRKFENNVKKKETIEIQLNEIKDDDTIMILKNKGHCIDKNNKKTKIPGNINVSLNQTKHKLYTRKGSDLSTTMTIKYDDVIDGFSRQLVCIDGKNTLIDVEPMSNSGLTHKVKGKGLKNADGTVGDLYIHFIVEFDRKVKIKNTPTKKTPVKKTPVKKAPVKKAPVKKAPVKNIVDGNESESDSESESEEESEEDSEEDSDEESDEEPVKKTPAKKTPAKKTPVKKTPVKKTPVKKTPVKKTPAKKNGKK